ncbi:hypothetical protein BC830DRAFT_1156915 [Chytriomyces sp. MP71]|nr:hypothetical protein BC830DRAFT_1156915 [Chytriomyces sp. MP71]
MSSWSEIAFTFASLAFFPLSWLFIHVQVGNTAWCWADWCVDDREGLAAPIQGTLVAYYIFLLGSGASALICKHIAGARRWAGLRPINGNTISVGEVTWFTLALTLACVVVPAIMWKTEWDRRGIAFLNQGNSYTALLLKTVMDGSGDAVAVLLGFVFLPTAKYSFLATTLDLPYTSLLRLHMWMGRALFVAATVHGGAQVWASAISPLGFFQAAIAVSPHAPWGIGAYHFGLVAYPLLGIVMITSLAYFRRTSYSFFYFSHFTVFVFLFFSYLHGSNSIFYILPGLCLYTMDGIRRLHNRLTPDHVSHATFEKCGYITLTVATTQAALARPGQFMRIAVPRVSRMEFHPFTVARCDAWSVTFLVGPAGDWTRRLETLLREAAQQGDLGGVAVCVQGPFGRETRLVRECARFDALVFNCGGTGVAAAVSAVEEVLEARRMSGGVGVDAKVFLFWSCPRKAMAELSLIQGWVLDAATGNVVIELFETGGKGAVQSVAGRRAMKPLPMPKDPVPDLLEKEDVDERSNVLAASSVAQWPRRFKPTSTAKSPYFKTVRGSIYAETSLADRVFTSLKRDAGIFLDDVPARLSSRTPNRHTATSSVLIEWREIVNFEPAMEDLETHVGAETSLTQGVRRELSARLGKDVLREEERGRKKRVSVFRALERQRSMNLTKTRAKLTALLNKYLLTLSAEKEGPVRVGMFVCGPGSFTRAALEGCEMFSAQHSGVQFEVEVESFTA